MDEKTKKECKCLSCFYCVHHNPGSFQSVAEGGDDPYSYDFCAHEHWGGEPIELLEPDMFADCEDYRKDPAL